MRIAVVGAGGVGGYLGARLWEAGHDVTFVARGAHLAGMKEAGLLLESPDGPVRVRGTFTDQLEGMAPFDFVVIGVKSFDTHSAAEAVRPVMTEGTIVMSVQNGVENEEIIGSILGEHRVLGCAAYIFSTIGAPGVIRHEGGTGKFKFGEMDNRITERALAIQKMLGDARILGEAVADIRKVLWEKWIFICGLGGMTAYARAPIGEVLVNPSHRSMLRGLVHEAADIARAKKVDAFTGIEEKAETHFGRLPRAGTSSMYYDRLHGKRVEVEALNGAAVRFGRLLKIETPANARVYEELRGYG